MVDLRADASASDSYVEQGCLGGNPTACYNYGLSLDRDWAKATEFYTRACQGGEELGCEELRYQSFWRRSDPIGDLQTACDQGNFNTCLYLAEKRAHPVAAESDDPADIERMTAYVTDLDTICRMGSVEACGFAASITRQRGNPEVAMMYANAGCGGMDGNACYSVGVLFEKRAELERALSQYIITCEMEYMPGCTA
ncbi:hypothetical protein [Halocynthiibacter sp.]|uniref:hypothetical protein n=1 Tax=Halocynthiibacter sp. TaxID=1979210 RepID=UPI003C6232A1